MKVELVPVLGRLFEEHFSHLSLPLRKNLALLAVGFIRLLGAGRSGQGKLTLAALIRSMPLSGSFKKKEKRVGRLLSNSRLEYRSLLSGLASLLLRGRVGFFPSVIGSDPGGFNSGVGGGSALCGAGLTPGVLHL